MKTSFPIKIDKVNIELIGNNNIRLRWTFQSKRYSLNIGTYSQECLLAAKSKAHEISSEIYRGIFSIDKYFPKPEKPSQREKNLLELWNIYLKYKLSSGLKEKTIAWFKSIDSIIKKLDGKLILDGFIVKDSLLEVTTVKQAKITLKLLSSCCQYAIKRELINKNPFVDMWKELPDNELSKPISFTEFQISQIINNFSNHPQYNYYLDLVLFWIYTGCRPSEAIALTWSDIKFSQGRVQVVINKAFSKGILNNHTKNYKTRIIPLNPKLAKFMIEYRAKFSLKSKDSLVFPSIDGLHLHHDNYGRRHFKPIVQQLVKDGKVNQYLSPYHLRHSFATNMLRGGVDIGTVAGLIGDNIQTVINHYIGSDYEHANLPDIY